MEKDTPSEAPPPYCDPRYPPTGGFPEGSAPQPGNAQPQGTNPSPAGTYPPPAGTYSQPPGAYSPPMANPGQPTTQHPIGYAPPPGTYPPPQGMYYPPPAGAHHQQGQHPGPGPAGQRQVVVIQQPTVLQTTTVVRQNFGPNPASAVCPYCQSNIVTSTSYSPGAMAWLMCIVLFFVFWPICWLPFVIDSCQDATHSCPNCGRVIATT